MCAYVIFHFGRNCDLRYDLRCDLRYDLRCDLGVDIKVYCYSSFVFSSALTRL